MEPEREGASVLLFLAREEGDGELPHRHLYWLLRERPAHGWSLRVPEDRFASWMAQAVPAEFPGGDKRSWRLATRYAQVRVRRTAPEAIGVSSTAVGDVRFEPLAAGGT